MLMRLKTFKKVLIIISGTEEEVEYATELSTCAVSESKDRGNELQFYENEEQEQEKVS